MGRVEKKKKTGQGGKKGMMQGMRSLFMFNRERDYKGENYPGDRRSEDLKRPFLKIWKDFFISP
jgi:hypothetical protein